MNSTGVAPTSQRIDIQAYFHAASDQYEVSLFAFEEQQVRAAEAKAALYAGREQLKDIEADTLVNGGHGKYTIDTTNATKREAMLRAALNALPEYVAKRAEVTALERSLAQAEAARDRTANQMSLAKRRMDAHINNTQRTAALLMYGPRKGTTASNGH